MTETKKNTMTFSISKNARPIVELFYLNATKIHKKVSRYVVEVMDKENERLASVEGQEPQPTAFNYESAQEELRKTSNFETKLFDQLKGEPVGQDSGNSSNLLFGARAPLYDALIALAVSLGSDERLGKNLPELIAQLVNWKFEKGFEWLTITRRQLFIQYLETVLKRRDFERLLFEHQKKRYRISKDTAN